MSECNWFPEYLNKNEYLSLVSRIAPRDSEYLRVDEQRKSRVRYEIVETGKKLNRHSELLWQFPADKDKG